MTAPQALLIVDDHQTEDQLLLAARRNGFEPRCARTWGQAVSAIRTHAGDVLVLDLGVGGGKGRQLLEQLSPGPGELILMTSQPTVETAVAGLRKRAVEYLTKPLDMQRVENVLKRSIQEHHRRLQLKPSQRQPFGPMLGGSQQMRRLYQMIARVAPTDASVLISGESGVGKELVAQSIHDQSKRRDKAITSINCGAVPENLIESELFGHERGAFTGAARARRGVFEQAHRGTLFLDEITEMPMDMQVRLLRVLETQRLFRVGGDREVSVDVRVIAATNRDAREAVEQGRLREDLLYRLSVFPIHVPPLRQRGDDIELLANHFLAMLNQSSSASKRFTAEAMNKLRDHVWPGNVRQLRNAVQQAFILADELIHAHMLPLEHERPTGPDLRFRVGTSIPDAERELIFATLEHFEQDKRRASRTLGISLKTLYNRLHAYGAIEPAPRRGPARVTTRR